MTAKLRELGTFDVSSFKNAIESLQNYQNTFSRNVGSISSLVEEINRVNKPALAKQFAQFRDATVSIKKSLSPIQDSLKTIQSQWSSNNVSIVDSIKKAQEEFRSFSAQMSAISSSFQNIQKVSSLPNTRAVQLLCQLSELKSSLSIPPSRDDIARLQHFTNFAISDPPVLQSGRDALPAVQTLQNQLIEAVDEAGKHGGGDTAGVHAYRGVVISVISDLVFFLLALYFSELSNQEIISHFNSAFRQRIMRPVQSTVPVKSSVIRKKVACNSLHVRERPCKKSRSLGYLHLNDVVTILHKKRNWSRVETKAGKEGWVFSRYLAKID
ncbi:MAG: SH3 domain-containing protein [Candidatus Wallbacteria bacterium]|nr:SH3 domain-containing protein [Candidatus Wallbacteria bacterium]